MNRMAVEPPPPHFHVTFMAQWVNCCRSFHAHKLVLVKSSEVFERMLSQQWKGESKKV